MSESYVQLPGNSTGSRMRTISGSIGGSVVEMEVVLIGDSGSYATITPAKTQQFPSALTTGGNLKVAIMEGSSGSSVSGTSITGSIGSSITGSIGLSITGSSTITTTLAGTSVGLTGSSVGLSVTGSTTVGDIGKSVTGSIGLSITGSSTIPITGSVTQSGDWLVGITGGSIGVTGSSTLNVAVVSGMSGSNSTATSVTGSIGLSVTGSTLSGISVTVPITGSILGGSIGITGSDTLNVAIVSGMSGSSNSGVSITGSTATLGITGSISGGSVGITGSSTLIVQGSVGFSGSVNILSTGSAIVITDNTGSMLITSGSGQTLKIYDAGFTSSGGVTYFYFGNTVAASAKRFCTLSGSGTLHKTFVQPRVGAASETVYIISTQAQTGSIDLGYVLE